MQAEALRHVGLEASARNLQRLRQTALDNPQLAVYVRNNICHDGNLKEGDEAPPVELISTDEAPVFFPPVDLQVGVPLVVIAGSVS